MKRFMSLTGFSLIETIIYAALFSVVIGLVVGAVYQITQSNEDLARNITTETEAQFLIRKIEWVLNSVSVVNLPTEGLTGNTLSVDRLNYSENPIIFDLDSGDVRIKRGVANPVTLNSSNVLVSSLEFEHLAPMLYRPAAVKISFNVDGKDYSTTIYLRKL